MPTGRPGGAVGRILIGTASWADRGLVECGLFYPASAKSSEQRLRYYASQFPLVEVDSFYYGLPPPRNAQLWVERTPPGFVFDVKAFRLFTQHQTPPAALPPDIRAALPGVKRNLFYRDMPAELLGELWRRFREAIQPLKDGGRLGVVLLQFPSWFICRSSSLDHILHCQDLIGGCPVAVEFRHDSWLDAKSRQIVLEFETRHGLSHVVADEPQGLPGSIPAVWEATAETSVVRLHGRNRETWNLKGLASSGERFNYSYSSEELQDLCAPIRRLATETLQVHVLFNNNFTDYAQRNARQMRALLCA